MSKRKTHLDNLRESALIGYMAGILDGEGCLRVNKSYDKRYDTYNYSPVVQIGMQCRNILEIFKHRYGGSIHKEKTRLGYKPVYRWRLSIKRKVIKLLKETMPLLIEKQLQAKCLLEYCKKHKVKKISIDGKVYADPNQLALRESYYQQMVSLKRVEPATTECKNTREGETTV